MFTRRINLLLVLILFILILAGCAKSSNPVTPGHSASISSSRQLWGFWHVAIDPDSLTAEAIPYRSADFTCNVNRFMQPPVSPTHMISIMVSRESLPSQGWFVIYVTLFHPFPGLNQYCGFDVRGIMLTDGSVVGQYDPSVLRAGPGNTVLENPDGYSRFWNWPEFTSYGTLFGYTHGKLSPSVSPSATVNPYKYFTDGLDSNEPIAILDPDLRGPFSTIPGYNQRRYQIQFVMSGGKPVFDFDYAVDASWSQPDPAYEPEYPIEAFDLTANCNEAYMVSTADNGSTAWYVDESDNGGEVSLAIEVFDHQAVENPDGMAGEVGAIILESDILPAPVDILLIATILPGSGSQSSIYEVTLSSLNLTYSGPASFFCTVESANVTTYEPQVAGGGAFDYPDATLSAFFTFEVEIKGESSVGPEVYSIEPAWGVKGFVYEDLIITGSGFQDGAVASLGSGPGQINAVSTEFIDSTSLNVAFDLAEAEEGLYDVAVMNPDNQTGVMDDIFAVHILDLNWDDDQVVHPTGGTTYWATSIDDRDPRLVETADNQPFIGWGQWPADFSAFKGAATSDDDGQSWTGNIWQPFACDRHTDIKMAVDDSDPDGTGNIYITAVHRWNDESICASKSTIVRWPMVEDPWHTGEQVEGDTCIQQEFIWTADGYPVHLRDTGGEIHCKVGTYQHSIRGNPSWPSGSWYDMPDPQIASGHLGDNRSIARDDSGAIHLAYSSADNMQILLISDLTGDGQHWGTPVVCYDAIEEGYAGAMNPGLDIADDGSFRIALYRTNLIFDRHVCSITSASGEEDTWSEAELIASDQGGTGMMRRSGIDSSSPFGIDVVGVTYNFAGDVYYAWKPYRAASWLVTTVNTNDLACYEPDTIFTSNSTVHVTWSQYDNIEANDIWHRRGTWSD